MIFLLAVIAVGVLLLSEIGRALLKFVCWAGLLALAVSIAVSGFLVGFA